MGFKMNMNNIIGTILLIAVLIYLKAYDRL